jgi:hypothetical protein
VYIIERGEIVSKQVSGEAANVLHMEREAREAAEERADDLKDALVEKNDRVIELERRYVDLRRKRDQARNQERRRIQEALGYWLEERVADLDARPGDQDDEGLAKLALLSDLRDFLDTLDPSGEQGED